MASSKKIGIFWDEEKITLIEFEKNTPLKVISTPLDTKYSLSSPFNSDFTEDNQIIAIFHKMLKDNHITGGSFNVSLPMKEIILRSFVIPFVQKEDVQNVVKFEAKKYLPIDIQDLSFVFNTTPFTENKIKRLQIIFFAVRKESLARYERIFKQIDAVVSYCEPCMVSLTKLLLFKKEIKPTDHLAFLILDKDSGSICFIDQGIPQFIREFSFNPSSPSQEPKDSLESLNSRIINEVGNSFNFYERQFSRNRIEQMLVSAEGVEQDLFTALEAELKIKLRKTSPGLNMGALSKSNDTDTLYAMGACIDPPMASLNGFNFVEDKAPKRSISKVPAPGSHKEIVFIFIICLISLVGVYVYFQSQLKISQKQYDQLASKQGTFLNLPIDSIQTELQQSTDKLAGYKAIRMKSDVALILLKVASHLPQGAFLKELKVTYDQSDPNKVALTVDMNGDVIKDDANEEIKVINKIFSDFKNDKELSRYIKTVNLVSLNREDINGKHATGFNIHCS